MNIVQQVEMMAALERIEDLEKQAGFFSWADKATKNVLGKAFGDGVGRGTGKRVIDSPKVKATPSSTSSPTPSPSVETADKVPVKVVEPKPVETPKVEASKTDASTPKVETQKAETSSEKWYQKPHVQTGLMVGGAGIGGLALGAAAGSSQKPRENPTAYY